MPESGAASYLAGRQQAGVLAAGPRLPHRRSATRGGQANQLYIFDIETYEAKKITEGAERQPRSDVDRRPHLLQFRPRRPLQPVRLRHEVGEDAQVTSSKDWDVRWPSTDRQDRIVFELDGELQVLNIEVGQDDADLDHGAGRWRVAGRAASRPRTLSRTRA